MVQSDFHFHDAVQLEICAPIYAVIHTDHAIRVHRVVCIHIAAYAHVNIVHIVIRVVWFVCPKFDFATFAIEDIGSAVTTKPANRMFPVPFDMHIKMLWAFEMQFFLISCFAQSMHWLWTAQSQFWNWHWISLKSNHIFHLFQQYQQMIAHSATCFFGLIIVDKGQKWLYRTSLSKLNNNNRCYRGWKIFQSPTRPDISTPIYAVIGCIVAVSGERKVLLARKFINLLRLHNVCTKFWYCVVSCLPCRIVIKWIK